MAEMEQRRRRSARISALDACKAQQPTCVRGPPAAPQDSKGEQLPERKRGRKKRRLRPVEEVVVSSFAKEVEQARENPKHEDPPTNTNQPSTVPSATQMPEKRVLELVLDILQRRDTHEIFAEPVDPEEVEGYYEIIKEPMDFGTMRAKLQEGLYTSLEQFENDVFLISSNAMHFNSSTTIFFRQARIIHELAKKVFHALKTDPENFELEFSVTRRRPGRRPQGEAGSLNVSSHANLAKSGGKTIDVAFGRPCSLYGPSRLGRIVQANPGSSSNHHIGTRAYENLSGSRDGKKNSFSEEERRWMYRPWTSFLNENESISSTVYNSSKSLVNVNQGGIGYEESLKRFVKDLGPTAQMVANWKLQRCQDQAQAPNCQVLTTSVQRGPTLVSGVINNATSWNSLGNFHGHPNFLTKTSDSADIHAASRREMIHQNQATEIQMGSYLPTVSFGELNFPAVGITNSRNEYSNMMMESSKLDNWVQSTELVSQSRLPEFVPRSNNSPIKSSWPSQDVMRASSSSQAAGSMHGFFSHFMDGENQTMAAPCPNYGNRSIQADSVPDCSQSTPWGPQAVFDISLLQSRLGETNLLNPDAFVQPELRLGLAPEKQSFDTMSCYQRAPVHSHQAELSLEGLSFDALGIHESAPMRSHQTELSHEGLSFGAMGFHESAPIRGHQAQLSREGLSFNAMGFHESGSVRSHQAELSTQAYLDSQQPSLLDNHQPDLALQL